MVFYIIVGVVMAVGFIGMIVCAKKQADYPIAKLLSFVLLGIVLICALTILIKSMGSGETKQLIANEMFYASASAEILGRHMAKVHPGAKALVIVEDKKITNDHLKNRLEALKKGMGTSVTVVDVDSPDLTLGTVPQEGAEGELADPNASPVPGPPQDMMMMMPIQEMMRAIHFDDMIARHADCALIVSFIGLPRDVSDMVIWGQDPETRPKMALLQGEVHALKNAITSGAISAAVAYRPDAKFDEAAPPDDIQAAFDKRYILITPENIEEIEAKYKLFAE